MRYKFKCTNCNKEQIVEMKPSEYTSEGHVCENCNGKLKRSIDNFAGGALWNCGGSYCKASI